MVLAADEALENNSLIARDRKIMWHPFTQEKTADIPIAIERGSGSYIFDRDGNKYLDLISSWWVNMHGHSNERIASAMNVQAQKLEHVMFAGFTHEPAVTLCEMLNDLLPDGLERFFFSDNGSTSVEIALKMSYQYWRNKGEDNRNLFLSFEGGYHGDTFGAMSIGKESGFYDAFKPLLLDALFLPFPGTWDGDDEIDAKEARCLEKLDEYLKEYEGRIASMILEPLVQGASGMRICRKGFLNKLVSALKKHDILVIFDEVMTGFGRTGTHFALKRLDYVPDFLCIAKGLTGGFLPLALTITSNKIYEAFLSDDVKKSFLHGHSYSGNPIACAAAIASLEILLEDSTQNSINAISDAHVEGLKHIKSYCKHAINLRSMGAISAFEVDINKPNLNFEMRRRFLQNGLLIRPLGNTVYVIPPYCTAIAELESSYHKVVEILNDL